MRYTCIDKLNFVISRHANADILQVHEANHEEETSRFGLDSESGPDGSKTGPDIRSEARFTR